MPASIFEAYVSGGASEFFPSSFTRAGDRLRAVGRARPRTSPAVLAQLEAQNARFGASTARAAHLTALANGAAAVVTGQQVGLFLGPLFTVYKAASAIRVARALTEASGRPVVPVFWLQTEDHDLPEIARCTVARPAGDPLDLALPADPNNHVSIAHLQLPAEIEACHAALEAELGQLPAAAQHLQRLRDHYRPGAGWAEAFAGVLAELFEPEGLLVLDPRRRELAGELQPMHERALHEASPLAASLLERCEALSRAGFEPTVHVRSGSPLAFFHPERAEGPRYRLAAESMGLAEIGGDRRHALDALVAALARDPLCCSTSALLRPIAQDSLLPTAAYVGGPAEVAYYAQLAPLYAAFDLSLPLVVPRARFRVIEPAAARLLRRWQLEPSDALAPEEALLRRLAADGGEGALAPSAFEHKLRDGFESVLASALEELRVARGGLQRSLDKTRATLAKTSAKLAERYANVLAHADASRVADVRKLKTLLAPHGVPQERVYGLAYYAARYGERAFLERVLAAIEPFDATPKELYL